MRSEFNIPCGRGQGVLVASPQQEVRVSKYRRVGMGSIPEPPFVLGSVRIDMGCMNLVTVISRYTRVPVTLIQITLQFEWFYMVETLVLTLPENCKSQYSKHHMRGRRMYM